MDVTIDFDEADLAFLDDFAARHQLPSRSASVSRAISMLRSFHLMPAYAAAFDEWSDSEESYVWDGTTSDGGAGV